MKQFCVIINPAAGKGAAEKQVPVIEAFFSDHGISYELHLTEYPGHAAEIAESHACSAAAAAGGDGTCNEVINGLMKRSTRGALGVLPIGSGNDFSFGIGLPKDLHSCLEVIRQGNIQSIDIGLIKGGDYPDGRYFGNGIGIGFDTLVGLEAAKFKRVRGAAGYALGALKTLWIYPEAPTLDVHYDDQHRRLTPAQVSIMNGKRMGGAFLMAPQSSSSDGLLDYCMTLQGKRGRLLKGIIHYLQGTQHTLHDTFTGAASSYRIRAVKGFMAVHADGELICSAGDELEITCLPSQLDVLLPKQHNR